MNTSLSEVVVTGMQSPMGLSVYKTCNQTLIYICEYNSHRVRVYNDKWQLVKSIGKIGTGDGEFQYPTDVSLAPSGNLWVADFLSYRIQEVTLDGAFVRHLLTFARDNLNSPSYIAYDCQQKNAIWVANFNVKAVKRYIIY